MLLLAAFCAGVILLYCSGGLLVSLQSISCLFLLFAILLRCWPKRPLLYLVLCLSGLLYASFFALLHQARILPPEWEGRTLSVQGFRCSLIDQAPHFKRFDFCLSGVPEGESHDLSEGVVRLYQTATDVPEAGRTYRLQVNLKRPHGAANPDGAPYEKYLFARGIVATGQVLQMQPADVPHSAWQAASMQVMVWQQWISERLERDLLSFDQRGVLRALLTGDRSGIDSALNQVFNVTGVQHLLAISGLHVVIVVGWLWFLTRRFRHGVWLVVGFGFFYVLLTGFAESAQRAWLMVVLGYAVLSGRTDWSLFRLWLLSLLLVLLWQPLATLLIGTWLSFVAVLILLVLLRARPVRGDDFGWLLQAQLLLMLAMLPIYQHFSLHLGAISLLANLLAIPLVSLLLLPLTMLAFGVSLVSGDLAFYLYWLANETTYFLLEFLRAISVAVFPVWPDRPLWLWLLAMCMGATLLLPIWRQTVGLFVPVLALFMFYPSQNMGIEDERFVVLDAGQGLAIVMQMRDGVWLYDVGPSMDGMSTAQQVIVPYLQQRSVHTAVTGLIVSHADLDHAGGYPDLVTAFDVKNIWLGDAARMQALYQPRAAQTCLAGMRFQGEAYALEVLYPLPESTPKTSNNHSCVVRLTWRGQRFLLMGDLEGEAEMELVRRYKSELKADVLIAGHHGSNNATRFALLKFVEPDYVVFASGYRNRFGHPHAEVLRRVEAAGAVALQTAYFGAISFGVDEGAGNLFYDVVRDDTAPFWVSRPGGEGQP